MFFSAQNVVPKIAPSTPGRRTNPAVKMYAPTYGLLINDVFSSVSFREFP